jgi:hypothetical protein
MKATYPSKFENAHDVKKYIEKLEAENSALEAEGEKMLNSMRALVRGLRSWYPESGPLPEDFADELIACEKLIAKAAMEGK